MRKFSLIVIVILTVHLHVRCQDSSGRIIPKYIELVSKKAASLEQKLDKRSEKALQRFATREAKLKRKLAKVDSIEASSIFGDAKQRYAQLSEKIKNGKHSQYISSYDTALTSFKFFEQNPQWLGSAKEKFGSAFEKVKELESKLQKAESIKEFLKQRRQFLKEQLQKFGFAKELKRLNKISYYAFQQFNEYRDMLNDHKKVERKAIELLSKTKLFQDFMKKNSMLASLFRMPGGDPNDPAYTASLTGLQTRSQVNALIQSQIAAGGPNAQSQIRQNIQQAQAQLQQLKDKIARSGGTSSDDEVAEKFKPNDQKSKSSFLKRLELGTNIQTQRARNVFPVTSDLGLSVAYKIDDNNSFGIGVSYKVGWGTGWRNIDITHQGIGLRSFADFKLKGNFYVSAGYEQNYRSEIRNIDQLRNVSAWQQSGLVGISKIVATRSKLLKKTKLQLLWDFLSAEQTPRTQPIIFRIGYTIK
jgi:hypothetical protein